eukprot:2612588-Pyramimonas_sp.AAC.1
MMQSAAAEVLELLDENARLRDALAHERVFPDHSMHHLQTTVDRFQALAIENSHLKQAASQAHLLATEGDQLNPRTESFASIQPTVSLSLSP